MNLITSLLNLFWFTQKQKSAKKQGRLGNTYHVNEVWWMGDGRLGGGGPHSNSVLDFIIKCSNDSQDPRRSRDQNAVLDFTGKKLALWFITHEIVVGHYPPYVHSRPPDIIHVIGVARPSPFFVLFLFYYIERKPKNKKRGRPANGARLFALCA